jgi:hypothetical protein
VASRRLTIEDAPTAYLAAELHHAHALREAALRVLSHDSPSIEQIISGAATGCGTGALRRGVTSSRTWTELSSTQRTAIERAVAEFAKAPKAPAKALPSDSKRGAPGPPAAAPRGAAASASREAELEHELALYTRAQVTAIVSPYTPAAAVATLCNDLRALRKSGKFADVAIICNGNVYPLFLLDPQQ